MKNDSWGGVNGHIIGLLFLGETTVVKHSKA